MNRFIAAIAFAVAAFFFTIPAWAQAVSVVTLTNGPPNIPNASPCTTTTCAWMPSNAPAGSHVSLVFADMSPISTDYTGTFSLGGPNASNFSISTSAVSYTDSFNNAKTRNVGEIKTSGPLPAGDYSITVTATGASGSNSQNVTVHSAACNSTPSPGGGPLPNSGTICLSAGTYNQNAAGGSQISNLTGTLLGIGNGATIIDGSNTACGGVNQNSSQAGGAIIGVQFQNYKCDTNQGYPVLTYTSTVVRNSRIINSNGAAVTVQGSGAFVANNLMDNMGYSGMTATMLDGGAGPTNIIGNEISRGNAGGYDTCNDAATIKYLPGFTTTINFTNNYIHDSSGPGPWPDTSAALTNISGNTFVRVGGEPGTILIEQTRGGTVIDHNVFVHNTDGSHFPALYCDSSAPVGAPPPYCGSGQCVFPSGDQGGGAAINVQGGANVNTHDNNISAMSVSYPSAAYLFGDEIGNGTGFVGNNTFHDNTVNFFSTSNTSVVGFVNSTEDTSGSSANFNHYHLIGGNTSTDAHWYWFNQSNTAQTFANYRSSGQDANATIDTTDMSTTGCTHVACSGSGIGAGGVPLAGPTGLSIQSVALSNPTFTPNVANGAVGTVSVTMSDGSAFSGKLSITGTNSGGFQLSGNSLQEKASGTPAGTYHDFNIVAMQSTASNSPQQISPTVTGVVEAPFGGGARSMTNRIQAEDFDVGGYSLAYRATDACGIGIDTAYGTDRLNVYPTADLDGGSNLKIGCNQVGDWHNYTITAATTGAYSLNLRVANVEAGATYHVAIDGATVVNGIAVPNTGGYDTFATVTSKQFGLTAGQHIMQIVLDTVGPSGFGGELNWMQGTLVAAGAIGTKNVDITVIH